MEIQIKKIENGYVIQINKWDILTGRPEVTVWYEPDLEAVVTRIGKL